MIRGQSVEKIFQDLWAVKAEIGLSEVVVFEFDFCAR